MDTLFRKVKSCYCPSSMKARRQGEREVGEKGESNSVVTLRNFKFLRKRFLGGGRGVEESPNLKIRKRKKP